MAQWEGLCERQRARGRFTLQRGLLEEERAKYPECARQCARGGLATAAPSLHWPGTCQPECCDGGQGPVSSIRRVLGASFRRFCRHSSKPEFSGGLRVEPASKWQSVGDCQTRADSPGLSGQGCSCRSVPSAGFRDHGDADEATQKWPQPEESPTPTSYCRFQASPSGWPAEHQRDRPKVNPAPTRTGPTGARRRLAAAAAFSLNSLSAQTTLVS